MRWYILGLLIAAGVSACGGGLPRITGFEPRIGTTGGYLRISGERFGPEQDESYVDFGGIIPTRTSYQLWTNTLIVVRIPDIGESCTLTVHRRGSVSKGRLLAVKDAIPAAAALSPLPVVAEVAPAEAKIGSVIELHGTGFGASREAGNGVEFTWNAGESNRAGIDAFLSAGEYEGAYEVWDDRRIRLRVPDGAASGTLRVRTPRGLSNLMPVSIAGGPGTKTLKDRKTYSINYSVDVRVTGASTPNFLLLWLPVPPTAASQYNKELLERSHDPFIEAYRGAALFQIADAPAGFSQKITVSYLVYVFAVETDIQPYLITNTKDRFFETAYTSPSAIVASDSEAVSRRAKELAGYEPNAYYKARAIYRALLNDAGATALDFCGLCRAAGVPALPVAGVLVDRNRRTHPHVWAVFWLDGLGWVPVDIVLGRGGAPPAFTAHEDGDTYYFGSTDSNRIIFSFGETVLLPSDARSRTSSRSGDYALQTIWEESSSGLISYSSHWSEITVTGVY